MKKIYLLIVGLLLVAWTALAQGPLPDVDPGAAAKTLFDGIGAGAWVLILDDLWSGATLPYDDPDIGLYIDFRQDVAPTLTPNIDNLGVGDLNVHNWANIVKNGP